MPTVSQSDPRAPEGAALGSHEREALDRKSCLPRSLMSKPQPLGILPSLWFWREIRRSEPRLHLFFTLLWAFLVAPLVFLGIVYLQPAWLSAISVFLISILGGGAIEKWLRLLVVRRRHLIAANPPEAPKPLDR